MLSELAGLNHCAVPVLCRADANLCRFHYTAVIIGKYFQDVLLPYGTGINCTQHESCLGCLTDIYCGWCESTEM